MGVGATRGRSRTTRGLSRREVRSLQRNSAHMEWREVRSRQWSSARMESWREVRSRQRNSACMESERASERASAAAALREVRSHQRHSAHMEGWREVQSRQRSSARVEWREVRSRQWNSARMKWPRNRHAGEPSPARLLKIPAQKCVGEVGGEGVFGTADLVCSRIFAERAGGVRVGVGEAHADCPTAVVEAAANLRRHGLPVGHSWAPPRSSPQRARCHAGCRKPQGSPQRERCAL